MMTDFGEKQPLNMMVMHAKEQMPTETGTITGEKSQVHQLTAAVRHIVVQRHSARLKLEMLEIMSCLLTALSNTIRLFTLTANLF